MELKTFVEKSHNTAKEKGFWDNPREIGTMLMLIVSELGEALEADRKGWSNYKRLSSLNMELSDILDITFRIKSKEPIESINKDYPEEEVKKVTAIGAESFTECFEMEIADTFIRLFDMCGGLNIDIEKYITSKMSYNEKRSKLHGKGY